MRLLLSYYVVGSGKVDPGAVERLRYFSSSLGRRIEGLFRALEEDEEECSLHM